MKRNVSRLLALIIPFALAACAAKRAAMPAISSPTFEPWPPFPTATPIPTPTEFQLPFNDKNVEGQYCQAGPAIEVSLSEAHSLSDDQIAAKLMELWLAYFNAPEAPDWCRIDGYKIDEVYYDAHALAYPPVEPQGDIMRVVRFSVRLIQVPNSWMAFPGEVDPRNWLHTVVSVAVFRSATGYTMKFANP